jgi:hypothetical protein
MSNFKIGDHVAAFGMRGVVYDITHGLMEVDFVVTENGQTDVKQITFCTDGRQSSWHKEPSLKWIPPPKKKVMKTFYLGVGPVPPNYKSSYIRASNLTYDRSAIDCRQWQQIVEIKLEV